MRHAPLLARRAIGNGSSAFLLAMRALDSAEVSEALPLPGPDGKMGTHRLEAQPSVADLLTVIILRGALSNNLANDEDTRHPFDADATTAALVA